MGGLAFSIALFLGACGNRDYGAKNASTNDLQKIIDYKQHGFLIIKNEDNLSKNPFSFEMPHVNALYYVENGEVIGEFNLELYEGIQQKE